jgi:hypothetical protein
VGQPGAPCVMTGPATDLAGATAREASLASTDSMAALSLVSDCSTVSSLLAQICP